MDLAKVRRFVNRKIGRIGEVTLIRYVFPLDLSYGRVCLSALLSVDSSLLGRLSRPPVTTPLPLRSIIFLDIETTALGTGRECQVFLVGLGRIEGETLLLEQYFLEHPRAETEILTMLRLQMEGVTSFVSFNGRLFDWPVLRSRFLSLDLGEPPPDPIHLDLLYPARRVWRPRVGSASLTAIEASVLGAHRSIDVPSWLVPSLYWKYLEWGDPKIIEPVLAHNLQDVLALPALLALLGQALHDPAHLEEPEDRFGMACLLEEANDFARAQLGYEQALQGNPSQEIRLKAVLRLADLYRRSGQFIGSIQLLEEEAEGPLRGCSCIYAKLAKLYERHLRDFAAAHAMAMKALDLLNTDPTLSEPQRKRLEEELVCRLERLERRLSRIPSASLRV